MITVYTLINEMEGWATEGLEVSPSQWLNHAIKINALRCQVEDQLLTIESKLAKQKANLLANNDMSVAKADAIIRAEDDYLKMKKLNSRKELIVELVNLAKKQATLKDNTMYQQ
jgi:hypothetical protein